MLVAVGVDVAEVHDNVDSVRSFIDLAYASDSDNPDIQTGMDCD